MTSFYYEVRWHDLSKLQPDLPHKQTHKEPICKKRTRFEVFLLILGRNSFVVKFLIVLSTLLMIPVIMKFQTETFLQSGQPKLRQAVSAVLEKHGVVTPEVELTYFDATIRGSVGSEETAQDIARDIAQIGPVRLVKNQLAITGWLEVQQRRGVVTVSGLVSPRWQKEALKGLVKVNTDQLRTKTEINLFGKSAASWGIFLDRFFQESAERTVDFRDNHLILTGSATPSDTAEIDQLITNLGLKDYSSNHLKLMPSRYHFPLRKVGSNIEGEPLRSLAQKLTNLTLEFEAKTVRLTKEGEDNLQKLTALFLETPKEVQFVIGVHPSKNEIEKGRVVEKRVQKIADKLIQKGIEQERLHLVPFEMTEDNSELAGHVEILIW